VYIPGWTYLKTKEGDIEMQRSAQAAFRPDQLRNQQVEPLAVLREFFELLEDYAPIWYTEELHNRAATALGELEPALS
jgi:hypothetical protein